MSGLGVSESRSLMTRPGYHSHQIPAARPLPVLCWLSGQKGSQPFPFVPLRYTVALQGPQELPGIQTPHVPRSPLDLFVGFVQLYQCWDSVYCLCSARAYHRLGHACSWCPCIGTDFLGKLSVCVLSRAGLLSSEDWMTFWCLCSPADTLACDILFDY